VALTTHYGTFKKIFLIFFKYFHTLGQGRWSLGRRSAFFSYFGPQSIKNLRIIGQNTDFSLNSESSSGRTKIFLGHMRPVGRRLDAPALGTMTLISLPGNPTPGRALRALI
jgi:hypothetical protein